MRGIDLEQLEAELAFRRRAIVVALARHLYNRLQPALQPNRAPTEARSWEAIESLSQLRRHVGGRFKTVKSYWLAAGLPLRAHRGDRSEQSDIDTHGWRELSLWLDGQGFEARLNATSGGVCFEIRQKELGGSTDGAE